MPISNRQQFLKMMEYTGLSKEYACGLYKRNAEKIGAIFADIVIDGLIPFKAKYITADVAICSANTQTKTYKLDDCFIRLGV
jgi:hypothetical protein